MSDFYFFWLDYWNNLLIHLPVSLTFFYFINFWFCFCFFDKGIHSFFLGSFCCCFFSLLCWILIFWVKSCEALCFAPQFSDNFLKCTFQMMSEEKWVSMDKATCFIIYKMKGWYLNFLVLSGSKIFFESCGHYQVINVLYVVMAFLFQDIFIQIFSKHLLCFMYFDTAVNKAEKFPVLMKFIF